MRKSIALAKKKPKGVSNTKSTDARGSGNLPILAGNSPRRGAGRDWSATENSQRNRKLPGTVGSADDET